MNSQSSAPSLSRAELRDQIEGVLKFLPVPKDDFERASVENNKLILIEDFQVENDEELRSLIMDYLPTSKSEDVSSAA